MKAYPLSGILGLIILSLSNCGTGGNTATGQNVVFTTIYMLYACDPCAQYKVLSVDDKESEFLMNQDVFLKFSDKKVEQAVENIALQERIPFKVWGKVLSKDGKDAFPNKAYIIQVDRIEFDDTTASISAAWTELHYEPVIYSSGATDTAFEFRVDDVSEGGSILKLHYTKDTLKTSAWYINSDTGQVQLEYAVSHNGIIKVKQINARFSGPIVDARGGKNGISYDSLSYIIDINGGIVAEPGRKYINLYSEFRKVAPIILTEQK